MHQSRHIKPNAWKSKGEGGGSLCNQFPLLGSARRWLNCAAGRGEGVCACVVRPTLSPMRPSLCSTPPVPRSLLLYQLAATGEGGVGFSARVLPFLPCWSSRGWVPARRSSQQPAAASCHGEEAGGRERHRADSPHSRSSPKPARGSGSGVSSSLCAEGG